MISQKQEFLDFAMMPGRNMSELCRRFGISRKSGYELLNRYEQEGESAVQPRSRAPINRPNKTTSAVEALLLKTRERYPFWGPRKIRRVLINQGHQGLPVPSTIAAIFERHGLPKLSEQASPGPWQRFEKDYPNQLWQMDFKGHVGIRSRRSHPLTIIDDYSRYCVCLQDCSDETFHTVQSQLIRSFKRYGLPDRILCDNGGPWKPGGGIGGHNQLSVWLLRLGIELSHGRPYHPQTQGKNERFNRTLKFELLNDLSLTTMSSLQKPFDHWRHRYNHIRPHDSLNDQTPIACYQPSPRCMPKSLPPLQYFDSDTIRKVKSKGEITFKNQFYYIGRGFIGQLVAIRKTQTDGLLKIFFATSCLGTIDLTQNKPHKSKYIPIT